MICATVCCPRRDDGRKIKVPWYWKGHINEGFNMDIVFIERLHIDTIIGIYDWERQVRQTITLDLEMAWDNTRPAASDDIDEALNYKAVSKRLTAFVEASSFGLVETLAERCAAIVREEFDVPWLRLRLRKPRAVRGSKAVGVEIERGVRP